MGVQQALRGPHSEDHEFAKGLDAEELEYFLSATPETRSYIKSNPDSPVGEEEAVEVAVEAPDGSVTTVAAAKPAGEAVTVETPEVSVTSAPAGTQTGVMKAANGNGEYPPKKKKEDEMDEIDKALYAQPIYKSRDGTLYYKETEAKLAAKLDDMEDEKKKEKLAAKTEKALNLYPNVPRNIVKHLVSTGAGEDVFKSLLSMNSQSGFLNKQFGTPVDDSVATTAFESLVAKAMDGGKVDYNVALTEVMKTQAGREAWSQANPNQRMV